MAQYKIEYDIEYKQCTKCIEWLPITDEYFYKWNYSKDGFHPQCKKCNIERQKKYQKEHAEERSKYNHKLFENDPEYFRNKDIKWRNNNPERPKELLKRWQQTNPDKLKEYNEIRQNKNHNITKEEWSACLKYFNYSCAYCGINEIEATQKYKNVLHKEHVVHDGENDLSNCVPACKSCNSSKRKYELVFWYIKNKEIYSKKRYNRIMKWLQEDYKNI